MGMADAGAEAAGRAPEPSAWRETAQVPAHVPAMTATTTKAAEMATIEPGRDQAVAILALILATTRGIGVRTRDCLNPAEDASPLRTNNSAVRGEAFLASTYYGVPALK